MGKNQDSGVLPGVKAVVRYLTDAGWKVSKSSFYNHQRSGKVRAQDDGSFKIAAVEKYAQTFLKREENFSPAAVSKELDDAQKMRAANEARKLAAQADHWELKSKIESGQYVNKDLFDAQLAARASIFKSDMENFIRAQADELIRMVDGDPVKAPDLIDYLLENLETWIGRYSEAKHWQPYELGR